VAELVASGYAVAEAGPPDRRCETNPARRQSSPAL